MLSFTYHNLRRSLSSSAATNTTTTLTYHNLRRSLSSSAATNTTTTTKWPRVAIVGVGQLGAAVASNLIRHDVPLQLFDLQKDANVPKELKDSLSPNVS